MPKNLQDYLGNKVTFLKWEDNGLLLSKIWICNVQWKMLDWDSRGYHQQLNHWRRMTPNLELVIEWCKTGLIKIQKYLKKEKSIYKLLTFKSSVKL